MAKATEPVGHITLQLLVGSDYVTQEVAVVAFVGDLAVHETVADYRLAEAKTAAYSVSHRHTGLGVINGVHTKKAAMELAEAAVSKAQELGLELGFPSLAALQEQPSYASWLAWAMETRSAAKTRKGFLYDE